MTSSFKGIVVDKTTQSPLIGVEIYAQINGTITGTTTDLEGIFIIENIPVGRHNFIFKYLGYEEKSLANILISSGKTTELSIGLIESIREMKAIEVIGRRDKSGVVNPNTLVSARTFSIEEASRFAGSFNDPSRMAQSFAGVGNSNDENNEIIVRGNSPRGIQWRMEGMEIPNPNHFITGEGGSGGAISMLSDVVLANSDFLTGAFPAEYGNALSGVFDLNLRNGSTEKRTLSLQAGVLGIQVGAEGPINKMTRSSYLLNYRYSTVTLLDKSGIVDFSEGNDRSPIFQDLSFKVNIPGKNNSNLSVYGLGGKNTAKSDAIRDPALWITNQDRYHYDDVATTGVLGVKKTFVLDNQKTKITSGLSANSLRYHSTENYINDALKDELEYKDSYDYTTLRLTTQLSHKFKPGLILNTGVYVNQLNYKLNVIDKENGELFEYLNDQDNTQHYQFFGQTTIRPNDKITINTGIHSTYFALNKQFIIEPRFAIRNRISDKSSINAGLGIHSRLETISLYLAKDKLEDGSTIQRNKNLELTKSFHSVVGWNYKFAANWHLKLEGYYQHLFNVPTLTTENGMFSSLNFNSGFTNDQLDNNGKGKNYGIEITVEKFLSDGTFLLFTSSLFNSQYQLNGEWESSRFNTNYIFNLLGGKEWSVGKTKSNLIGFNARMILHGGDRQIPVDIQSSHDQNQIVLEYDKGYAYRVPDFYRLDTSFKYQKNLKNWSWTISIDIQNVLNRENVLDRFYSISQSKFIDNYQLPLLPIINYTVAF